MASTKAKARRQERQEINVQCPLCKLLGYEGPNVFRFSIGGWEKHVGAIKSHPDWHPYIKDPVRRREHFRKEFPDFFTQGRVEQMRAEREARKVANKRAKREAERMARLSVLPAVPAVGKRSTPGVMIPRGAQRKPASVTPIRDDPPESTRMAAGVIPCPTCANCPTCQGTHWLRVQSAPPPTTSQEDGGTNEKRA